mgnify:CR=1 FL=1
MDFLPPQCGGASPSHRAPRTVAPPQWAQPDLRHSVVARHRAPSHRANASYFLEYNAVFIVFIPSWLPLHDGVTPVACFTK